MNDNNTNWKPILPFGIDNGELDSMTPQDIFTRGFEMGRTYGVAESLDSGDAVRLMIHSDNQERNCRAALSKGCGFETAWVNDDWMDIIISK